MSDLVILKRLQRVSIEHFRGFVGPGREYDTDADLVLLLGPNGKGKTSFLEALQLALTGIPATRERAGKATDDYASLLALKAPIEPASASSVATAQRHSSFEVRVNAAFARGFGEKESDVLLGQISVRGSPEEASAVRLEYSPDVPGMIYPPEVFGDRKVAANEAGAPNRAGETARLLPGLPPSYLAVDRPEGAMLQARLTAFFQHDVGQIFDDAAEGRTVLDLVAPIPVRIRQLGSALDCVSADLAKQQGQLDKSLAEEQEKDREALVAYSATFQELLQLLHPVAPALVALPSGSDATELAKAVAEVLQEWGERSVRYGEVPSRLATIINRRESGWRKSLEERARGSASDAELETWEAELAQRKRVQKIIRDRHPRIEAEATAFLGAVQDSAAQGAALPHDQAREGTMARLPGLLPTLESLQGGLEAWTNAARQGLGPRPSELHRELEAIRSDALAAFTEDLRIWTQALEQDRRELLAAQREQAALERELLAAQREQAALEKKIQAKTPETAVLKRFDELVALARRVPSAEWLRLLERERWEAEAAQRVRRRKALEFLQDEVEGCAKDLQQGRDIDPIVLGQLEKAINEVSRRFSIAGRPKVVVHVSEETLPDGASEPHTQRTRLSVRAKLGYQDGRRLAELSSGQHSQMAVAFLVAQNLLVAQGEDPLYHGMPHRVLLLDDVSSTYDLTNLVRESILWRQLAYTDKLAVRRQIFLSSHHEDLTNQLIDHLVPPEGYRMRVLRFTDWKPDTGPVIEAFTVEPSRRQDDSAAIAAFKESIGALFHGA